MSENCFVQTKTIPINVLTSCQGERCLFELFKQYEKCLQDSFKNHACCSDISPAEAGGEWGASEAEDLGHGRPGALFQSASHVLQGLQWGIHRLRHDQRCELFTPPDHVPYLQTTRSAQKLIDRQKINYSGNNPLIAIIRGNQEIATIAINCINV